MSGEYQATGGLIYEGGNSIVGYNGGSTNTQGYSSVPNNISVTTPLVGGLGTVTTTTPSAGWVQNQLPKTGSGVSSTSHTNYNRAMVLMFVGLVTFVYSRKKGII